MKKEKWINEVFESTKNLERQEAPAFLFEKVIGKIELSKKESREVNSSTLKWAAGFAAVVVLTINIFSVKKVVSEGKHAEVQGMNSEMQSGLNNSTIYNY